MLRRLEAHLPHSGGVACHGDFNVGQLVRSDSGIVVLDVDELTRAPAALDLAAYAGDLIAGRSGDLSTAQSVLHDIVEGYGRRPEGLGWYLAATTLRRAPNSFRLWKSRWPERLEGMIAAADEVLAW